MRLKFVFAWIAGALAIAAVIFFAFYLWLISHIAGDSKIQDRVEVESPDERYIASGYHLWGGATVSNATIIEIRPKSGWFNKNDTLLSEDMTVPGNNPFDITWSDDTHLTVAYTPGQTYLQKRIWRDVNITYVEK